MTVAKRGPGRPRGSFKPVTDRRTGHEVTLSQEAWDYAQAQGNASQFIETLILRNRGTASPCIETTASVNREGLLVPAAEPISASSLLTYEAYMAAGEINRRYEIIDGERIYMTGSSIRHQEVVLNLALSLRDYQHLGRHGKTIIAPCDVLISREPLRTRQPDMIFISRERYAHRSLSETAPFDPAPELVIEVLSPNKRRSSRIGAVEDYCRVCVKETWLVSPQGESVEVLRLTSEGPVREALYGIGQTLQSLTFPDLTLALDDIFRIEE